MSASTHDTASDQADALLHRCGGGDRAAFRLLYDRWGSRLYGIALRITWPAVLPMWIAALRSGLGLGFMFVVAAELLGASEGLGYLLLDGQQMGRADSILVAIIVFALLGQLCDSALVLASKPLLRWQDTVRTRL